jgi:hypothetical protein
VLTTRTLRRCRFGGGALPRCVKTILTSYCSLKRLTRPKQMYALAKLGFSQSYTYFTWRYSKHDFTEYLT